MKKETALISACLLGVKCRYDTSNFYCPAVVALLQKYNLIPFCPELLAGMRIPRAAVEIIAGRAMTLNGENQTKLFLTGAKKSLKLAQEFQVKKAFLKSGSPSCGCDLIYDGSFSDKLIPGKGFVAQLFDKYGIETFSERSTSFKRPEAK
jgi:uncharacterized protein YbbK (DUF523 family)